MFKSPNKQMTEIVTNEASLMVKQFENLNITIYGTYENPLFRAKDMGELLDIKNIRDTINKMKLRNIIDKVVEDFSTPGGIQNTIFLTEQGLYKVLMKSRKPIAEQFQDWVGT